MIARNAFDRVPGIEHPGVQLLICLTMDAVGMFSYLLPVLGELGDLVWAPINALFIMGLVGGEGVGGWAFAAGGFTEEILPFTDFIPSCTMAWIFKVWHSWRGR